MPLEQPDSRPIGDRLYRLHADYRYPWEHGGACYQITVPEGFEYDGNSVPRWVWSVAGITPDGLNRAAGLVHDFLYADCGRLPEGAHQRLVMGRWLPVPSNLYWSRRAADRMYGRLLREAGVSPRRRRLAYRGVRIGGAWPWYVRLVRRYFSSVVDYS